MLILQSVHPLWGVKQLRVGKTSYSRAKWVNITRQMALTAAALLQTSRYLKQVCNLFSRRIRALFGMLSRCAGLSVSAGLSCLKLFVFAELIQIEFEIFFHCSQSQKKLEIQYVVARAIEKNFEEINKLVHLRSLGFTKILPILAEIGLLIPTYPQIRN